MTLTRSIDWTVPVSYCADCDKGRTWQEIPDEPCGCDLDRRRTLAVPVVPVDALLSDEAIAAARAVQAEARGIDLKDSINAQALGPDEWRWARASLQAAVDAATGLQGGTDGR